MTRKFACQSLGVMQGLARLDFEFVTDSVLNDFVERRGAIRGLPENGCSLVERKQSGVATGHEHHLSVNTAGCDPRIARKVTGCHRISSQSRTSGTKVRRKTWTR